MKCDIAVIGAGPAGLAAAHAAHEAGCRNIVILERDFTPGGILNQCIHSGFGLRYFKEELTGPEYAERFIDMCRADGLSFMLDTMALSLDGTTVHALSGGNGVFDIEAKAVVLAMGCRERTRGAIAIPGARPSGILTAGAAQRYINIEGKMVGRRAVILGSGDIGLIMARRLTLEGAKVLACVEVMPYSSGLPRNKAQCLDDFGIPLLLKHTITDIEGRERVTGVTVAEVDDARRPVPGTETHYDCDTVLLSVGLIPENELSRSGAIPLDGRTNGPVLYDDFETDVPGVFAAGNVAMVHDLVDYVTEGAIKAGKAAAEYVENGKIDFEYVEIKKGEGIAVTLPQRVKKADTGAFTLLFRVTGPMRAADIVVKRGDAEIIRKRREYLTPGETELLPIAKKQAAETLTVSAEEIKQ